MAAEARRLDSLSCFRRFSMSSPNKWFETSRVGSHSPCTSLLRIGLILSLRQFEILTLALERTDSASKAFKTIAFVSIRL